LQRWRVATLLKLREAVSMGRELIAGLALRALLAADPEAARDEARQLLRDPRYARAALGVFALSEPALQEELDSLDTIDTDAVLEAGSRVLAWLEASNP